MEWIKYKFKSNPDLRFWFLNYQIIKITKLPYFGSEGDAIYSGVSKMLMIFIQQRSKIIFT